MRYAWTMTLKPGGADGYVALHEWIWPEMSDALDQAGYRNYTIFLRDDTVVGCFECDDLEAAKAVLGEAPVAARWRDAVARFAHNEPDPATGLLPLMQPVFHLPGRAY